MFPCKLLAICVHMHATQAPGKLSLARLDAAVCVDAEDDDDDEEGSEDAEEVTTGVKDHTRVSWDMHVHACSKRVP